MMLGHRGTIALRALGRVHQSRSRDWSRSWEIIIEWNLMPAI
jgi:hypothetical protein